MAAAVKAINAKIRSNKVLDYFCSTHFWGPASNFGIPLAAVMDTQKDPEIYLDHVLTWHSISGKFTAALTVYSATFMRYAMAVTPKNYLLFACHFVNFNAQLTQGYRWYNYWYGDGMQRWHPERAGLQKVESAVDQAKEKATEAVDAAKKKLS